MSGNVSLHAVDILETLTNGKNKWVPVTAREGALEVFVKSGEHIDTLRGVALTIQGDFDYEAVGTSATDQVLGTTGAVGDFLHAVVVQITTSGATGVVSLKDGSGSSIPLVPASTPVGVYQIELNIRSTGGAWKLTTGAAATALASGIFTP
jgi:hypothetical protein